MPSRHFPYPPSLDDNEPRNSGWTQKNCREACLDSYGATSASVIPSHLFHCPKERCIPSGICKHDHHHLRQPLFCGGLVGARGVDGDELAGVRCCIARRQPRACLKRRQFATVTPSAAQGSEPDGARCIQKSLRYAPSDGESAFVSGLLLPALQSGTSSSATVALKMSAFPHRASGS